MLVSHNIVTCLDPELPASLSPASYQVLREELGFEGVAMTDDLDMDAVQKYVEEGTAPGLTWSSPAIPRGASPRCWRRWRPGR